MMTNTIRTILSAIVLSLVASSAMAAERTYCFELLFKDDRTDCPVTGDPGVRRACVQDDYNFVSAPDGDYTHPRGALIEVWDRDDVGSDEYIGTWFLSGSSGGCVTFEWENSTYDLGEPDPDPYVIWRSEVRGTGGGPHVLAVDASDSPYGGVSFRPSALTDCEAGASCWQPGLGLVTRDSTTELGGRAMSLDSAQHMLEVYSSILEASDINMRWPMGGSVAIDQTTFEVASDRATMAQSVTHELGHVLHMQQYDLNGLSSDCSLNGSGHTLTDPEFESCATAEGFAGYVAAVSLWDPENDLSAPSRFGFDFVDATPFDAVCANNSGIEGQVVKAFWDLDDDTSEPAVAPSTRDDEKNSNTLDIAERWAVFPAGTGNREKEESDVDGPNNWDYHINSNTWWSNLEGTRHTLMGHNCLGTQDTN
jgi:hypothetical protein